MSSRSLVCSFPGCEKRFKSKENMKQHQEDSHKIFICDKEGCQRMFRSKSNLEQHRTDFHISDSGGAKLFQSKSDAVQQKTALPTATSSGSLRKYACVDCGAKFVEYLDLHNHQRSSPHHFVVALPHKSAQAACSKCSKTFKSPLDLENHYAVDHSVCILSEDRQEYQEIAEYFNSKWSHSGSKATIREILKIYNPGSRVRKYEQYRGELKRHENESQRKLKDERIMKNGNQVERFHGTRICCSLGIRGQSKLCNATQCSLCSILRSGFKLKAAKAAKFQRFGPGIYTTATSSKADSYVLVEQGAGGKAMLLCYVLAGQVFKLETNRQALLGPPPGYNSVCGEAGNVLNYDELVVYNDKAILPRFLIIYDLDHYCPLS